MKRNVIVFHQDDMAYMAEFIGTLRYNGHEFEVTQCKTTRNYEVEVFG